MRKTRGRKKMSILTGRRPTRKINAGGARKQSTGSALTIVPMFLHMLNSVKLYHWKTTSYSTHKATDELYDSLNSKIDHFVEVMLGKDELGGRSKLLNVNLVKLDSFSIKKQVEHYKSFLLNLSNDATFSAPLNVDLLAIRDEILADLNKFLYLLGAAAP
jgi:hypothetical protein